MALMNWLIDIDFVIFDMRLLVVAICAINKPVGEIQFFHQAGCSIRLSNHGADIVPV